MEKVNIKTTRESGVELLRIFCAIGVIIIHFHDFCYAANIDGINKNILLLFKSLAICSVDIFILISGYYMIKTEQRNLVKIALLILQVVIFNLFFRCFWLVIKGGDFLIKDMISALIPVNYYVALYSTLFLISPYINFLLKRITEKARLKLCVLLFLLFSIYPTILDFSQELIGKEWWGLSTISAWGNQQGFNIVNFILLYIIGACINLNKLDVKMNNVYLIGIIPVFFIIFIWAQFEEGVVRFGMRSAWCYHNPLVISLSILIFILFKKVRIYSNFINSLAEGAFACYLINSVILKRINIDVFINMQPILFVISLILCSVFIYLLAYLMNRIYKLSTKCIERKYMSSNINYNLD